MRLATGGTSAAGGLAGAFTGGNAYSSNRISLTLGPPASSGTAQTPPLGVLQTAAPTPAATAAPAVSLTIAPRSVSGVTSATSGGTTPQTLQASTTPAEGLSRPVRARVPSMHFVRPCPGSQQRGQCAGFLEGHSCTCRCAGAYREPTGVLVSCWRHRKGCPVDRCIVQ